MRIIVSVPASAPVQLFGGLLPEISGRLLEFLGAASLATIGGASRAWTTRVLNAERAWELCFQCRFGLPKNDEAVLGWRNALRLAIIHERRTVEAWAAGQLQPEHMFIFASFVRSWASLVAGLYDGTLQLASWETGEVGNPFKGRHGDEVVCVAFNSNFVLSGSGDPGYYQRPAEDASVKLWHRNDGRLIQPTCGHGHGSHSVRSVILFNNSGSLGSLGLSAGMDGQVSLFELPTGNGLTCLQLPGPCRAAVLVPSKTGLGVAASEARVIAAAGCSVAELSVRSNFGIDSEKAAASMEVLHMVSPLSAAVGRTLQSEVAGLACFIAPEVWTTVKAGTAYPNGPLTRTNGVVVAGGSIVGELWVSSGSQEPEGHCVTVLAPPRQHSLSSSKEVASVELIHSRWLLAVSRDGQLQLVDLAGNGGAPRRHWRLQGWRMYVSTIRLRESRLLVSDGFDNVIQTFRVSPEE